MKEKLIRYRKRLLAYSLAMGIGTVSLTGCTDFIYDEDENGNITVSGDLSYDSIKDDCLVVLNYTDGTKQFYICDESNVFRRKFIDEQTNKVVLKTAVSEDESILFPDNVESAEKIKVSDYLIKEDKIKERYSIDDVKEIKYGMIEEYKKSANESNKELVK